MCTDVVTMADCSAVPEKIHTHSKGRSSEIPRGRGVLKVKILERRYEAKLEFPRGKGSAKQNPSLGGLWIFSGTANLATGKRCILIGWLNSLNFDIWTTGSPSSHYQGACNNSSSETQGSQLGGVFNFHHTISHAWAACVWTAGEWILLS